MTENPYLFAPRSQQLYRKIHVNRPITAQVLNPSLKITSLSKTDRKVHTSAFSRPNSQRNINSVSDIYSSTLSFHSKEKITRSDFEPIDVKKPSQSHGTFKLERQKKPFSALLIKSYDFPIPIPCKNMSTQRTDTQRREEEWTTKEYERAANLKSSKKFSLAMNTQELKFIKLERKKRSGLAFKTLRKSRTYSNFCSKSMRSSDKKIDPKLKIFILSAKGL